MDDFDLAVSSDGSTDPALLKSRRGDAHREIRQQRIDEAMQEDGVDSIVVGDKSVWFHGRVVAGAVLVVYNDCLDAAGASEYGGGGFGDARPHRFWDLDRLQFAIVDELSQDGRQVRFGGLGAAAVCILAENAELVVDRAIFDRLDCEVDVNAVAEAQRRGEFTLSASARPAD